MSPHAAPVSSRRHATRHNTAPASPPLPRCPSTVLPSPRLCSLFTQCIRAWHPHAASLASTFPRRPHCRRAATRRRAATPPTSGARPARTTDTCNATTIQVTCITATVSFAAVLAAAALTAKSCGLAVSPCRRAAPVVAPPGRELHAFHRHISPAPYSPTAPHDCKQPLTPRLPSRPRPPLSQSPPLRTVGTRQQELLPGSQPASQPAKHSTPPPLAFSWVLRREVAWSGWPCSRTYH